jgi:hypothetical protein
MILVLFQMSILFLVFESEIMFKWDDCLNKRLSQGLSKRIGMMFHLGTRRVLPKTAKERGKYD